LVRSIERCCPKLLKSSSRYVLRLRSGRGEMLIDV